MNDEIFFNQSKYTGKMLKKFGLENFEVTKTPRKRVLTLDKDNESIDSTKYRGMIGSLLYLTTSKPDIMFGVFFYDRFQEDPKVSHLEAVKRIFRYIKGTQHLGLWYAKDTGKQTSRVNFITESEYVAARRACQQVLWMKQAFMDYNITLNEFGESDGGGGEFGGEFGSDGYGSMCSIGGGGTLRGGDIGEFKKPLVDGDVEELGDLGLEMEALVDAMEVYGG
nr:hypothetical protein [Tanacetum cinerariifolium]